MPKVTSFALYDPEVSLYTCLNVSKDADQATIKKSYYKLALAHHPDKQSRTSTDAERDQATARFQRLGFAYAVLGDPIRRRIYDQTGDVSEDVMPGFGGQGQAPGGWDAYFRELWGGIVNESTIKEFERTYRFSDEEKRDVIHAYVTYRGDMDGILSAVPVCSYADEERFRKIIQSAIDAKVARKYKAFGGPVVDQKAAARRKREAEAEAAEAEQLWRELGLERLKKQVSTKRKHIEEHPPEPGSERELQLMMMQNHKNRQGAMDALIEKYSTPKKPKKEPKKLKKNAAVQQQQLNSAAAAVIGVSSSSNSAVPQPQHHHSHPHPHLQHHQHPQQQHYQQQQQQQQQPRFIYDNEPSEEEFMAIQAKLLNRKAADTAAAVGIHPSLTTSHLHHQPHTLSNYNPHHGMPQHNVSYRAPHQHQPPPPHPHHPQQHQRHPQPMLGGGNTRRM
ncbi:hypothetical protein BX616_002040 [Lobosporangium transversale]|nr:hypothetical protein BX616_002040 [Lobosporangium transversale]